MIIAIGGASIYFIYSYKYRSYLNELSNYASANIALIERLALSSIFYKAQYSKSYTVEKENNQINKVIKKLIYNSNKISIEIDNYNNTDILKYIEYINNYTQFVNDFNLYNNISYKLPYEQQALLRLKNSTWSKIGINYYGIYIAHIKINCIKISRYARKTILDYQKDELYKDLMLTLCALLLISICFCGFIYVNYKNYKYSINKHTTENNLEFFKAICHELKNGALELLALESIIADTLIELNEAIIHGNYKQVLEVLKDNIALLCHAGKQMLYCIQVLAVRNQEKLISGDKAPTNINKLLTFILKIFPQVKLEQNNNDKFEDIIVKTHEASIYTIICNMIQNALRHGLENSDVTIELINYTPRQDFCEIRIINQGGINHIQLYNLYKKCVKSNQKFISYLTNICSTDNKLRKSIGNQRSTFRGVNDMYLLSKILDMYLNMIVTPTTVETSLKFNIMTMNIEYPIADTDVNADANADAHIHINMIDTSILNIDAMKPTIIFMDDQKTLRMIFIAYMRKFLNKTKNELKFDDMQQSFVYGPECYILGDKSHCNKEYISEIINEKIKKTGNPCTLLIIDQNLDVDTSNNCILGTDIIKELQNYEYRSYMYIVVRSANMDVEHKNLYKEAGCDNYIDKGITNANEISNYMQNWVNNLNNTIVSK